MTNYALFFPYLYHFQEWFLKEERQIETFPPVIFILEKAIFVLFLPDTRGNILVPVYFSPAKEKQHGGSFFQWENAQGRKS